jgi:zinc transport system substrate-binding protein
MKHLIAFFSAFIFLFSTIPSRALENVVVTIAPLHSLVAAVMGDTGNPYLLVPAISSPHSYNMRPSDAEALQKARLVFRISRGLELFLERPLEALAGRAEIVALVETRGLTLLDYRGTEAEHAGVAQHHEHDKDPHIWLDPVNASKMVATIAAALVAADPDNARSYRRNSARLQSRLNNLLSDMSTALQTLRDIPYVTYHDGFQYLDFRFQLRNEGVLIPSPELPAGAGRIADIRELLESGAIVCVFSEPQLNPRIVETLIEGTAARHNVLDSLGAGIEPGPELYFELMRQNLTALTNCLGGPSIAQ